MPDHIRDLCRRAGEACKTAVESDKMVELLTECSDIFSKGPFDLGRACTPAQSINLKPGTKPIKLPPYRLGLVKEQELELQVQELLKGGQIRRSTSPYSFPVVLVGKRDGTHHLCADMRELNKITIADVYPVPSITDNIDRLAGSK